MGRRQGDTHSIGNGRSLYILLLTAFISCFLAYMALSSALKNPSRDIEIESKVGGGGVGSSSIGIGIGIGIGIETEEEEGEDEQECCRGMENLELWGSAVKWGTNHKFNSSVDCCKSCKAMCGGQDGPCLCDSWVFCGDRLRCGEKFGECWLKKQKDVLFPALQELGEKVVWTSGLIFGRGEGIVGLETDYGTLHVKLMPDCAPRSVSYIVELLGSRHCAGCQIYRAEGRGNSWDSKGIHLTDASFGPPYALIQGTLEAEGVQFKKIPTEACPTIRRGSVAWIGSGPEFFISLANHDEWRKAHTVFGSVLPEDMEIAEKITNLPTKSDVWNNFTVSVLEKPIRLKLRHPKSNTVSNVA